jgi:NAD/NADP transhydrogenase alpha subunit
MFTLARESDAQEPRVALTPETVKKFKAGADGTQISESVAADEDKQKPHWDWRQ